MQYTCIKKAVEAIESRSNVRNLGCFFDFEMKMIIHAHHILKCGYYKLRKINILRRCLTKKPSTTLVLSLIFHSCPGPDNVNWR